MQNISRSNSFCKFVLIVRKIETLHPQFLADQLIFFQTGGGRLCPTHLLLVPPNFQTLFYNLDICIYIYLTNICMSNIFYVISTQLSKYQKISKWLYEYSVLYVKKKDKKKTFPVRIWTSVFISICEIPDKSDVLFWVNWWKNYTFRLTKTCKS